MWGGGVDFLFCFSERGFLCLGDLAVLGFSWVASSADVDWDGDDWLGCDRVRLGVEGVLLS